MSLLDHYKIKHFFLITQIKIPAIVFSLFFTRLLKLCNTVSAIFNKIIPEEDLL